MGVPGSVNNLLGAGGAPQYLVERSIRLNSADSAFLSRTPASAGNRKTWTWAGWVKRSGLGTGHLFVGYVAGNDNQILEFRFSNNQLHVAVWTTQLRVTTQVFRDTSAWAHVVLAVDTTQAVANDRVKLYWNGAQITQFDTTNNPAQNADLGVNQAGLHTIGQEWTGTATLNGYLADIHFIDGQALTPSSFAETNATTGQWVPKAYTGTYGTNGFRLDFSDNSAATATTLGKDRAGSNNWTPSGLSVTAGAGNDSLVDTPTSGSQVDTGLGGQVTGNYCTFNPLVTGKTFTKTLSNGNLDASITASTTGGDAVFSTFQVSTGKWYMEFTPTNTGAGTGTFGIGMMRTRDVQSLGNSYGHMGDTQYGYSWNNRGDIYNNGVSSAVSSSYVANDVLMLAVDFGGGKLWFGKNGTWLNSGNPAAGTGAIYTNVSSTEIVAFGMSMAAGTSTTISCTANWGARPFAYTAPSGFKALCDTSLPAPTIALPSTVMDVKLYTGNGSTQTISGLGFSPDLVWIKSRSAAYNHRLLDTVRGATKELYSSETTAETTQSQSLTAFNSDGFSLGTLAQVNESSTTFAGWCWDAGSSTTTNNSGSISSQVRANASAGCSVVAWTKSPAGAHTVGHGLGAAPQLVIVKSRSLASEWAVYHSALGATKFLKLNTTDAAGTVSAYWNDTAPTSTTISLGSWSNLGGDNIAYCFAPVAGYSAMGSYVGNSSADGPFVYTGFRPRFIMIKNADATTDWVIVDTARETYNVVDDFLRPNSSAAEGTRANLAIDILSNGFKQRGLDNFMNGSNTHIYAAFAESPFQYARAR